MFRTERKMCGDVFVYMPGGRPMMAAVYIRNTALSREHHHRTTTKPTMPHLNYSGSVKSTRNAGRPCSTRRHFATVSSILSQLQFHLIFNTVSFFNSTLSIPTIQILQQVHPIPSEDRRSRRGDSCKGLWVF
jgi:hypothetical protein